MKPDCELFDLLQAALGARDKARLAALSNPALEYSSGVLGRRALDLSDLASKYGDDLRARTVLATVAIHDVERENLEVAARVLFRAASAEGVLLAYISSFSPEVLDRDAAYDLLAEISPSIAVGRLQTVGLYDPSPFCRSTALDLLSDLNFDACKRLAFAILNDKTQPEEVRRSATYYVKLERPNEPASIIASSLSEADQERSLLIQTILFERTSDVRAKAAQALIEKLPYDSLTGMVGMTLYRDSDPALHRIGDKFLDNLPDLKPLTDLL